MVGWNLPSIGVAGAAQVAGSNLTDLDTHDACREVPCLSIPALGLLRLGSDWPVIVALHPKGGSFCLHAVSAVEMKESDGD